MATVSVKGFVILWCGHPCHQAARRRMAHRARQVLLWVRLPRGAVGQRGGEVMTIQPRPGSQLSAVFDQ